MHGDDVNAEPIALLQWLLTRIIQEQVLNLQGHDAKGKGSTPWN
jgi:hypothetical protein